MPMSGSDVDSDRDKKRSILQNRAATIKNKKGWRLVGMAEFVRGHDDSEENRWMMLRKCPNVRSKQET